MVQVVAVADAPAQTLNVQLGGQSVTLDVRQLSTGLFMDVSMQGAPVITGVVCENMNRVVRNTYLGFVGDFAWYDTQGVDDPSWPGLGGRFQLLYLEALDVLGRDVAGRG